MFFFLKAILAAIQLTLTMAPQENRVHPMLVGERKKLQFQEFFHFFFVLAKCHMALLVAYALKDLVTGQASISAVTHR